MTKQDSPDAAAHGPVERFWQAGEPFVLLEFEGRARLYRRPAQAIEAWRPAEIRPALERLRGRHAAGYVAYEAGYALEPKLAPLERASAGPPLLWFGLFDGWEEIDSAAFLPDPAGAWAGPPRPRIGRRDHEESIDRVLDHILAGDIYQANLTFQAEVMTAGHPLALYAAIRPRARAGWGGIVFTGEHWLLSFSPELFFTVEGGRATARPMKGTAPAGSDPDRLRADPKQRAENLMIVDLLRNDLSRLAKPGTVEVPALFDVETYPTVLQMTSTVTAELEEGRDSIDLVEAIFPCGSVTGAPKIRAMEIIAELEREQRGPYTGSIGRLAPDGTAEFNVAIRTLVLKDGETLARIGLGSGIVADSDAAEEWLECLAKGEFVATAGRFDLIETMRFDPLEGIAELDRHLARMKRSADAFGFDFDRHHARNELQAATFFLREARKLRLALSPSGALAIEARPLPETPAGAIAVALAPRPVEAADFRLRHKTSDRRFYDEAREAAGTFEVIFVDREGFVTEGSFTSLFVERGGTLLTPRLARGLLPGVLREALIDEGRAEEADLRVEDLEGGFFVGNSVRGLLAARLS
ncbi:MAG TPA: aminodeoxychorismate synthase component I [Allosphingosinicella sp.]|nr:aminodeoxychorismate synthase component I [Allosphingosinicella sp.]